MIDLTPILNALIRLMAAIFVAFIIPWVKARTTAAQQEILHAVIRSLVFAAEQLYGGGRGEEKLTYVIAQLENRGYKVNREEIEAVVGEYINHVDCQVPILIPQSEEAGDDA